MESEGLCHSGIQWEYEVSSSEFFPFRAYAVALRDREPDADEAIILSVQGHRPSGAGGDQLVLYADITRGDGSLLAESPQQIVELPALSAGVEAFEPQLEPELAALERWLREHHLMVDEALAPVA